MNRHVMKGSFYVITYDISDDRRRVQVSNLLKSYGERVQYSVFECWLTATEVEFLRERLKSKIDLASDSIRFYRPEGEVEVLGTGPLVEEVGFYVA